ncbi:MAG: ribose 5-phosphate isomerase B [Alphaproteobacteria bacterium]
MKIAIGSDHAGFALKNTLIQFLEKDGYTVIDCGPSSEASVDYPDFAQGVVHKIKSKEAEEGILICGTGIGMSMAANRCEFIRGTLVRNPVEAKLAREHNDANVLCLGARLTSTPEAIEILKTFLKTKFSGESRHVRRLGKLICAE